MVLDPVTIFVSLTAAFVLGALFVKFVGKVLKLTVAVLLAVFLVTQIPTYHGKACALAKEKLGNKVSLPLCK